MAPVPEDGLDGRARLFTVRVWPEVVDGGVEPRGQAREVGSGAFCSFRRWAELTAFLAQQVGEPGERHPREEEEQS